MGEAVGGLTARMGFFALEPDSPWLPSPPGSELGVYQRNAVKP